MVRLVRFVKVLQKRLTSSIFSVNVQSINVVNESCFLYLMPIFQSIIISVDVSISI